MPFGRMILKVRVQAERLCKEALSVFYSLLAERYHTEGINPFRKGTYIISLLSLTENWQAQNFGRELVFSADLCYNDTGDVNGRTEKSQDHSVERCGL